MPVDQQAKKGVIVQAIVITLYDYVEAELLLEYSQGEGCPISGRLFRGSSLHYAYSCWRSLLHSPYPSVQIPGRWEHCRTEGSPFRRTQAQAALPLVGSKYSLAGREYTCQHFIYLILLNHHDDLER